MDLGSLMALGESSSLALATAESSVCLRSWGKKIRTIRAIIIRPSF